MDSSNKTTVFDALSRSNAELVSRQTINQQLGMAYWRNDSGQVDYNVSAVHTLSLYTRNGENCRRLGASVNRGETGSLCLIPIGQQSSWQIDGEFEFAHLYFSDKSIKRFAVRTLDIEPNLISVPDLTFRQDRQLAKYCRDLFQAEQAGADSLAMEEQTNHIFGHLLSRGDYCYGREKRPLGGISQAAARRVMEYIHCYYYRRITLTELAEVAAISEFHLQRMFSQRFAVSPSEYLIEVRIAQAKLAIRQGDSLADVASACGFSHQSHLHGVFKRIVGITPGQYSRRC
jgi:AraC family transcriptional regulator